MRLPIRGLSRPECDLVYLDKTSVGVWRFRMSEPYALSYRITLNVIAKVAFPKACYYIE